MLYSFLTFLVLKSFIYKMPIIKKRKCLLICIVVGILLIVPFLAQAVNDMTLNGIVNIDLLTGDTAAPTTILASGGGQVTQLDVQANYIDITLDNLSSVTFNTTAPGNYFNILTAPDLRYTATLNCPPTQLTLTGTGATIVVRIEVNTTYAPCGGGGAIHIYPSDFSILINNNSAKTTTRNVILNLQAKDAVWVIVSDNSNFYGSDWEPFTNPTDKNWILETGNGIKTVYAIFKSLTGEMTPILSDTIELQSAAAPSTPPPATLPPATPPPTYGLTLQYGDLLKGSADTIYYYGSDGQRHTFSNRGTYDSYYKGDFSKVKKVSDSQLSTLQMGYNMTYKPGIKMIKVQSDPRVYAVAEGAVLRWVASEEVAESLYGAKWLTYIDDLNPAFFMDYKAGEPINQAADFPQNLLPQISTTEQVSPTGCKTETTFTDFLEFGSVNAQVRPLQELLQCLGYISKSEVLSGHFGPATEAAVKKIQQDNNIEPKGYVGPATREALNKYR